VAWTNFVSVIYIVLNRKGGNECTSISQPPGWVGRVYNIVYGCCNIQILMHSTDNLPSRLLFYQILQITGHFEYSNLYYEVTFGTKKKCPNKTDGLLKEVQLIWNFLRQDKKKWHFNTGDCLIEVTECADLPVFVFNKWVINLPHELTKLHPTYWKCITLLLRFLSLNLP